MAEENDSMNGTGSTGEPAPADGAAQPPGQTEPAAVSEKFAVDMSSLTEDDVRELLERAKQREEYLERLQILQAEHENYRKRMAREAANHRLWGLRDLALDMLPAVDNLEKALQMPDDAAADKAGLRAGVKIVLDMLVEALSRHGARPIEAVGRQFDPAFHEAIGELPTSEIPPGKVAAELQKGYTLKDIVIRPSRVLVAASEKKSAAKE